ncbi:hypothetical protein OQA88_4091 [Cercophora sp. LCS_1]
MPLSQPDHSVPETDEEESDWEDDDDAGNIISSPNGLRYNIGLLPPRTQRLVRGVFNDQEQPRIFLESCGIKEEGSGDEGFFYAFQLHEVVPCSIRIGSRSSARWSTPVCKCPDAIYHKKQPCKHLVWLFDSIARHSSRGRDINKELTMTGLGYPEELGDPFQQISELRLDILADSLHCDTTTRNGDTTSPNRARVREAREMVAAVAGIQPHEVDGFRLDLETSDQQTSLIHRGDVEATLFSLLLASHSLAARVRAELTPPDAAVDPFRSLQRRAQRIISELDAFSSSLKDPKLATARQSEGKDKEGPRDVSWAASQIRCCVSQIEELVSRGARPLTSSQRVSAARALVGILKSVASHNVDSHAGGAVEDRNLYMCLIGGPDSGFIYSVLDMLVDQSQYVEELEFVMELIGRSGAPESYVSNMRDLITRMRSHTGIDSRRSSMAFPNSTSTPRNVTPPFEGVPPKGPRPETGSEFPSTEFLTPELPASASRLPDTRTSRGGRGRGAGRGRAAASSATGSKRSSSGGGQERGGGSKRPR